MSHRPITDVMIDYYRERAPIYDESMHYTDPQVWQRHGRLVDFLNEKLAGHDVLEIACGTGRWTQAVAPDVRSIVATDINWAVLEEACKKTYPTRDIRFQIADAYTLANVEGRFSAAYAVDWLSHVPRSRIRRFLHRLHGKLLRGAVVVFIDQLPRKALDRVFLRYDREGNLIQRRVLPGGLNYEVIKNFPGEHELRSLLDGMAEDIEYFEDAVTRRWALAYRVARSVSGVAGVHHQEGGRP